MILFFEPGDAQKFRHVCEITSIVPRQKFQHTWTFPDYSAGVSTLTWELSDEEGKTRVRLSHDGLENFAESGNEFARANFDAGWEEIVTQNLINYLIQ
ncbi:MAG: SRPBCC domain-containing protein [Prolixibacteraceae bacterium]